MMAGIGSYSSAAAFRQALEDRLKTEALRTGVAYDRLRKEASFQRLLARLQRVAPPDSWALKAALALIARIGTHMRATRDVDANWRMVKAELEETIDAVIDTDLEDGFDFEIGDPVALAPWPPEFNPPRADWESPWLGFITDYPIPWRTAANGYEALAGFWLPILKEVLPEFSEWHPDVWEWKRGRKDLLVRCPIRAVRWRRGRVRTTHVVSHRHEKAL